MKRNTTRQRVRKACGVAAAAGVLAWSAGCTYATGGSQTVIAQALGPHIGNAQPPCLPLAFPLTLSAEQADLKGALRALAQEGLLVERDQIHEVRLSRTGRLWVPQSRFELTERGRRHYREDVGGFCV